MPLTLLVTPMTQLLSRKPSSCAAELLVSVTNYSYFTQLCIILHLSRKDTSPSQQFEEDIKRHFQTTLPQN